MDWNWISTWTDSPGVRVPARPGRLVAKNQSDEPSKVDCEGSFSVAPSAVNSKSGARMSLLLVFVAVT